MNMLRPAALLLCACIGTAVAQQPAPKAQQPAVPARQPTPEQQAAIAKQNADVIAAALKVAQMIDAGQVAQVYDNASPAAKRVIQRQDFINGVATDRSRVGAVTARGKAVVTRTSSDGAGVPAGLYLNVSFPTKFANAAQPLRELVSYRFDEDKVWRVTGYSIRQAAPAQSRQPARP